MSESFKYREYVDAIGEGDITRTEAANMMGVSKSTARYHLEKAVSEGVLERVKMVLNDTQVGFIYRKKGVQPLLPFEGVSESEPDVLDQLFENGTDALDLDTWDELETGEPYEDIYDGNGIYSHTTSRDARWEI